MPIRHPRPKPDAASEAMGNLFMAGIDIEGLSPFAEAFPAEHYLTLPILERALPLFRALGITALKPTWQTSCRNGHSLFIADTDFTPDGVRGILQRLRDSAEERGIIIRESSEPKPAPEPALTRRHSAPATQTRSKLLEALRDFLPAGITGIVNNIAREISDTAALQLRREMIQLQPKREALAAWLIKKFWPETNFRAVVTDFLATKFNIVNADEKYTGYSIEISSLPPFEARILRMKKVNGRWVGEEVFRQTFNPRT